MVCFFYNVGPESTNVNITQHAHIIVPSNWWTPSNSENIPLVEDISKTNTDRGSGESEAGIHPKNLTADPKNAIPFVHPCANFAFPPPPPLNPKRIGPRRKLFLRSFSRMFFSCMSG